jgi:hypothetical protein
MWKSGDRRMRKRVVVLSLALALITASSVGYVAVGARLYQRYQGENPNYQLDRDNPCGALITWSPPQVLYTGFYGNEPALATLRYRSAGSAERQTLRITLSIPRFTQEQTLQVQGAPAFQTQAFKPPLLGPSVLDTLTAAGQLQSELHLRVQTANGTACDTSTSILLMSPEWMHWGDPSTTDNSAYLAGWVTPAAPAILDLIGRTDSWIEQHPATYPGITALRGYDAGRAAPADVRNQVNALFDTLQSVYHIHYAADNLVYGRDQLIRLPQDVLSSRAPTGMCAETTAVLASAVEHLGMRPYIVIVPGHAFLGVALGVDPGSPVEYWETSDLNGGIDGSQANLHGNDEYATESLHSAVERVIDIQDERAHGIAPIE